MEESNRQGSIDQEPAIAQPAHQNAPDEEPIDQANAQPAHQNAPDEEPIEQAIAQPVHHNLPDQEPLDQEPLDQEPIDQARANVRPLYLSESEDSSDQEPVILRLVHHNVPGQEPIDLEQLIARRMPEDNGRQELFDSLGAELTDDPLFDMRYFRTSAECILKAFRVKKIGKYVHGEMIGEGSYSKVKEAIDETTLQRRAMKIMTKQRLRKIPRGEDNARRELAVLRKLNHKNCVKLIDYIYSTEKEKMYLILDFCFTSLQQLSECGVDGKLPDWQTHKYFRQVLTGIDYLHSIRVVHNDIKPGNLLITAQQVIKICDFGVSYILNDYVDSDMVQVVEGTPAFAPPEVADGQERVHGFKIDMWAAGITLYKFVAGFYPYSGDNIYLIYEEIIARDPIVDEKHVESDLLRNLLLGLLKRNPDERLSITEALNHTWVKLPNHPDPDRPRQEEVKINVDISKVTSLLNILHMQHAPPEDDSPTHEATEKTQRIREVEREKEENLLPGDKKMYRDFWRFSKRNDNDERIIKRFRNLDKPCIKIEEESTFFGPLSPAKKGLSSATSCNQS